MTMGFMKKNEQLLKLKKEESYSNEKELKSDSIYIPLRDPSPKLKSFEEKAKIKKKLETKFEKIAERIVTLALETADYDEERAEQFLKSTITEDQKFEIEHLTSEKELESNNVDVIDSEDPLEKSFRDSGIWEKTSPDTSENKSSVDISSCSLDTSTEKKNIPDISDTESVKVINTLPISVDAPKIKNITLEASLVSKNGYKLCTKLVPKGSNKTLLSQRYVCKGPNQDLHRGPQKGLAKGSTFAIKKGFANQSNNKDIQRGECIIF